MKKIFSILIILLPFLYQYKSPINSISFGEMILIPFIIIFLLKDYNEKIIIKKFNGLYIYLGLAVVTSVITSISEYFSYKEFLTVFLRIIYYSLLIYVAYNNFEVEFGYKCFRKIALFFTFYLFFQYFFYKKLGIILPTVINKNWVFAPERGPRLDYSIYYQYFYRPSSLFIEASYYTFYMGPILARLLCKDVNNKRDKMAFIEAIIISVGLIICTASSSIIILFICWFGYLIEGRKNDFKISKTKIILVFIALAILIIMFKSDFATTMFKRLSSGGSFNIRITRGLVLSQNLDFKSALLGVGINNLENYVEYNNLRTDYDFESLGYTSSVIGTYICSGIFVFVLYMNFYIISFLKNKSKFTRVMIILLFCYSFIEMTSFTYRFAYYAIQIFALQNLEEQYKEEG